MDRYVVYNRYRHHGVKKYLYTINHKRIALNYLYFTFVSGLAGAMLATFIRLELSQPGSHFFKGDSVRYIQVITSHGLVMIFYVVIPIVFGTFANFFIPYHVGSKDVAYPRLNSIGFWILPAGFLLFSKPAFLRRQTYKSWDPYDGYFSTKYDLVEKVTKVIDQLVEIKAWQYASTYGNSAKAKYTSFSPAWNTRASDLIAAYEDYRGNLVRMHVGTWLTGNLVPARRGGLAATLAAKYSGRSTKWSVMDTTVDTLALMQLVLFDLRNARVGNRGYFKDAYFSLAFPPQLQALAPVKLPTPDSHPFGFASLEVYRRLFLHTLATVPTSDSRVATFSSAVRGNYQRGIWGLVSQFRSYTRTTPYRTYDWPQAWFAGANKHRQHCAMPKEVPTREIVRDTGYELVTSYGGRNSGRKGGTFFGLKS